MASCTGSVELVLIFRALEFRESCSVIYASVMMKLFKRSSVGKIIGEPEAQGIL